MMRPRRAHPDQMTLDWSKDPEIERIIEARVAIRAEAAALRWRLRLILIESVMMASLVLAAGTALKQPLVMVVYSSAMIGLACLLSGLLLIALSGVTGQMIRRYRQWRRRHDR